MRGIPKHNRLERELFEPRFHQLLESQRVIATGDDSFDRRRSAVPLKHLLFA